MYQDKTQAYYPWIIICYFSKNVSKHQRDDKTT